VEAGDHVLRECFRHDCSLLLLPPVRDQIAALLEGVSTGAASFLHCIERDDYTDKCYVD
jgi:hypothetical protein